MGKKKEKSKIKGAEKTALKTEKNIMKKTKKMLAEKGEKNIKDLLQECSRPDPSLQSSIERKVEPPTRRCNASFTAHPEQDEVIMFGGEFYNGSQTVVYNDLLVYNIKSNEWSQIRCPVSPAPRCSHQAAILRHEGGQLWIFGGEFPSPKESQFYHFNDLWVFRFKTNQWEQISKPGGPCARSGHRMVSYKHQLIIFGGFHDYVSEFRYFNDIYSFDVDNYTWSKIDLSGNIPSPRSGCQLGVLSDNSSIVLYGGYSKERLNRDTEKGVAHSDLFILTPDDSKNANGLSWKCSLIKQKGTCPSARSGFSMLCSPGNRAVLFGGVHDEQEEDENLKGVFYNDLYSLNIKDGSWHQFILKGKKEKLKKRRRRKGDKNATEQDEDVEMADDIDTLDLIEPVNDENLSKDNDLAENSADVVMPHPRMNASLTVRNHTLFLYGGIFEDEDKQYTLGDFYSLDLMKLDEWNTIISDDKDSMEWESSDDSSDEDDESDEDSESDSLNSCDMKEEEVPHINENEELSAYFDRTKNYWLTQAEIVAKQENIEATDTLMNKAAFRMTREYFDKNKL